MLAKEELGPILEDIAALPARQRDVLLGKELEEQPQGIAAEEGLSVTAIKSIILGGA
jgi:DNA-directed RNA polymerase specialized sigma24 family protein